MDVTDALRGMVQDGCISVISSNAIAGDPEHGVKKKMHVRYILDGQEKERTVPEGVMFSVQSKQPVELKLSKSTVPEKQEAVLPAKPARKYGKKILTIVISCREGEDQKITLESLAKQTFQDFNIVVSFDEGKGANYARNKGFESCDTEFVLFSDNDINWEPDALEDMLKALKGNKKKAYVYGWYKRGEFVCSKHAWNVKALKKQNYINTMAIIRTKYFPGFDEKIQRLQDWDLWLNMLSKGHKGLYLNQQIFSTEAVDGKGITFGGIIGYDEAAVIVKNKWRRKLQ